MNIQFLQGACNHDDGTAIYQYAWSQPDMYHVAITFCHVGLCAYAKLIMLYFVLRKGCICQLDYFYYRTAAQIKPNKITSPYENTRSLPAEFIQVSLAFPYGKKGGNGERAIQIVRLDLVSPFTVVVMFPTLLM